MARRSLVSCCLVVAALAAAPLTCHASHEHEHERHDPYGYQQSPAPRPQQSYPGCHAKDRSKTSSEYCHPAPMQCPKLDHVIFLVMENQAVPQILNKTMNPKVYEVAHKYSMATQYYGYTHNSEPNYVAMVAGTNACDHDDGYSAYPIPSLFEQLVNAKKTYKCYSQALPYDGYMGSSFPGDFLYMYKHNPCSMLNFTAAPERAHLNTNYEQFIIDLYTDELPLFSFVVPDQCHDNHGFDLIANVTGLTTKPCKGDQLAKNSDNFVGQFFELVTGSAAWKKNTLVVMVWDENDYTTTSGCCGSPIPPMNTTTGKPINWAAGKAADCPWGTIEPGKTSKSCPSNTNAACEQPYRGDTVVETGIYGGGNTLAVYAYSKAQSRCELNYPMNHLSTLKTLEFCWGFSYLGYTSLPNVPFVDECIFQ